MLPFVTADRRSKLSDWEMECLGSECKIERGDKDLHPVMALYFILALCVVRNSKVWGWQGIY
jgi:hypothetical protein